MLHGERLFWVAYINLLIRGAKVKGQNYFTKLLFFLSIERSSIRNNNVFFQVEFSQQKLYSVFQGFSKAKSANGGSILSSSQFLILPQLLQKIKLASKVVKVN
jgi:hypothetical protein